MFCAARVSMLMSRTDLMQDLGTTANHTLRWRTQEAVQVFVEGGWLVGKTTLCRNLCAVLPSAVYVPEPDHCFVSEHSAVATHYIKQHQENMDVADGLRRLGKATVIERSWISTFAYNKIIGNSLEDTSPEGWQRELAWEAPRTFVILESTDALPIYR